MRKIILFTLLFSAATTTLHAQLKQTLKKVLELKMPKTVDDDMPGTRGACVVWHPLQKKYYAVFAGNMAYPLGVFDVAGKRISGDDLTAMNDTRGLWYNPVTKEINGNTYADNGWFKYRLDKKGIPDSGTVYIEGSHQPDEQTVGAYHPVRKEVMFLKRGTISLYSEKGVATDAVVEINWGRMKQDGKADSLITETPADYNSTSVVYTGIKGAELGFLNAGRKQIELYDFNSGYLTKEIKLPEDAPAEYAFNFAYANSIYWLFNIEERKWIGYK